MIAGETLEAEPLLQVAGLSVDYATDQGAVRAVDDVSLEVARGEFVGIVGESGCGKSTLLFAIARLLGTNAQVVSGTIRLKDQDLLAMDEDALRRIRWRDYSVVMQSAMNALNPVLTVGDQLKDTMAAHEEAAPGDRKERPAALLKLVGIDPLHLKSYPHQLSGGMRQRAMIAMALVFTPDLVVMDEPTSALDVVAQRALMQQIKDLQRRIGFAVLFVTHDMSVVSHFSDRLAVMYAGQIVELGPTREIFANPLHPYTQALMASFPSISGPKLLLNGIPGAPPDLLRPPAGCHFHPRCSQAVFESDKVEPPVVHLGSRMVRCHLYGRAG